MGAGSEVKLYPVRYATTVPHKLPRTRTERERREGGGEVVPRQRSLRVRILQRHVAGDSILLAELYDHHARW